MAFKRARARVAERSTTSGSGPWTLGGVLDNSYQSFSSFLSNGDTIEVTVREPGVAVWTGIATFGSSGSPAVTTITATTVEETFGTFGAGTKEISADFLASRALLREDMAGAITTGGTSSAYTVSSFTGYATLARLDGKIIAFTMHTTNASGGVTLAVDGLTAKPLRMVPSTDLLPGVLIQGTPYMALYNATDGVFYLHGFHGDPGGLRIGDTLSTYNSSPPNSAFAAPNGQAINRVTFAGAFSLFGTSFGSGNGSTTFNIPDETGCVEAMVEASATKLTSSFFGGNSTVVGTKGGLESNTLDTTKIPSHAHANSLSDPGHFHSYTVVTFPGGAGPPGSGGATTIGTTGTSTGSSTTGITISNANAGGGGAHANVQPTIIKSRYLRVL